MAVKYAGHRLLAKVAFPGVILGLCVLAAAFGDPARELLRYEWAAIESGEWWRIFSAHLAHLSGPHLLMNAAGLALVWLLVGESFDSGRWLVIVAVCAAAISLGLQFLSRGIGWYVGLSGILHGVLAAGVIRSFSVRPIESALLMGALALKLAWEQLAGPLPGSAETAGGAVIVDAHLYGAVSGVLVALAFAGWDHLRQKV